MNITLFANLLVIASAPVLEPAQPLPLVVTCMGRRVAGARHICEDCNCELPEDDDLTDGEFCEN